MVDSQPDDLGRRTLLRFPPTSATKGSGVASEPFDVAAGAITSVPCARVRVVPLAGADAEFVVLRASGGVPLLRGRTGPTGELVLPGDWTLAPWTAGLEADRAGTPLLPGWPRLVARAGVTTTFWVDPAGAYPDGEGDVGVTATSSKNQALGADPAGASTVNDASAIRQGVALSRTGPRR